MNRRLRPRLKKGEARGVVVVRGRLAIITTIIIRDEAAVAQGEVKMVVVVVVLVHHQMHLP